jgi:hypothetical protein
VKSSLLYICLLVFLTSVVVAQNTRVFIDSLPPDLPLATITTLNSPSEGFIYASVPYWGNGSNYLVAYDNKGRPAFYKKTGGACTDFKMQENGRITFFDYAAQKFFAMDSSPKVVDSFWVQNGFGTDEHDMTMLPNGNVLIIGNGIRFVDMRQYVPGGNPNASVIVSVIQELDPQKKVLFEWNSADHYNITDAGPGVNLLDPSFVHAHINSVCVDLDGNLIVSARNLDEVTKINRKTGDIIWRFGGKNNQFRFTNDSIRFSAQHSVSVLPNGNVLMFDNGAYRRPAFSRAIEYHLDAAGKTAERVWSYRNNPDVVSEIWGNVQRLNNGNTLISWGKSRIAATEVTSAGEKVLEMMLPDGVFSYRMFRFPFAPKAIVSGVSKAKTMNDWLLEQNYPNPFNPQTTISYRLAAVSRVRLAVFDILGREVAVLADEIRPAGTFTSKFDGSGFPSGVYISRLVVEPRSGDRRESLTSSRTMILLK